MPKKRGRTRLVAKRLLENNAEDNDLDYFGQFTKRQRTNNDSNGQNLTSKVPVEQLDDRMARRVRREADKLSQTRQNRVQTVSLQRGTVQLSEEDDNEDDDDSASVRIARAMNQARNRTTKPTINGIGSLQRNKQRQHTDASSGDEEDNQEELYMSHSPEGDDAQAPRSTKGRSRGRRGANRKAPQQQTQRSLKGRGRPSQKHNTNASPTDEDESAVESSTEMNDQSAEDTAFIEPPQQGERTETIKVGINSMGGIFKTLQHPAWTGFARWDRDFGEENNDGGQKTCKTRTGKALMDEMQGLNNILEEATEIPEASSEDDHDFTSTAMAYLRTKSMDVQHHLARIDKIVDEICCRKLRQAPGTENSSSIAQAVKKRRMLLNDLSHRLIPMFILAVKKACNICPSEDNRSRVTLYVDCFRLQFFLRPLAWADRLYKAFEKGLSQGTGDKDSQMEADDPDEDGSMARDSKQEARAAFASQLDALYSSCRKAEREIQDKAAQAERREREAEIKRQNRERQAERQREIAAENKRKHDEQARRDEKALQNFFKATQALRARPDPLKLLWDQSQAALPRHSRTTSTVRAAPTGSSAGHVQRTAGAARSQGGPSRNARVESISDSDDHDSDDPFSENYRPRLTQTRNASRPWSEDEDKAMIMAIRYRRNYDVVLMAQKLQRSEEDVARKAAFLKQGYREAYTQKGVEIPAWAL